MVCTFRSRRSEKATFSWTFSATQVYSRFGWSILNSRSFIEAVLCTKALKNIFALFTDNGNTASGYLG
jgi:hypothetical protein